MSTKSKSRKLKKGGAKSGFLDRGCSKTDQYSEVVGSTDLIFGMQGALMCLVETLEFQNTQRPLLDFQPKTRGWSLP